MYYVLLCCRYYCYCFLLLWKLAALDRCLLLAFVCSQFVINVYCVGILI